MILPGFTESNPIGGFFNLMPIQSTTTHWASCRTILYGQPEFGATNHPVDENLVNSVDPYPAG